MLWKRRTLVSCRCRCRCSHCTATACAVSMLGLRVADTKKHYSMHRIQSGKKTRTETKSWINNANALTSLHRQTQTHPARSLAATTQQSSSARGIEAFGCPQRSQSEISLSFGQLGFRRETEREPKREQPTLNVAGVIFRSYLKWFRDRMLGNSNTSLIYTAA